MGTFEQIKVKLQNFIIKFYVNELIKGLLLFFSLGFIYFIVTLFVEHLLWLKPLARTLLFWIFIGVELLLFTAYILAPLIKIIGFKKGINEFEASKIIGNHFPKVRDKLLNMLQLQEINEYSELIEASIEQKSKELKQVPFRKAIDFNRNKKFIKYALIPIGCWLLIYMTGNSLVFSKSFSRVVHYNTQFERPAPFSFKILNESLIVVEGEPFALKIEIVGSAIPEDVKVVFLTNSYYLKNKELGKFQYDFSSVKKSINFYLEANGVNSKNFRINCLSTPVITNLKMVLNYPNYTRRQNEVIQNTGNAIVPQGTKVSWQIETAKTEEVSFKEAQRSPEIFIKSTKNYFSYSKQLLKSTNYTIATSNNQLKHFESLNFKVEVVSDEYPTITVKSDIDAVSHGPIQFMGQLTDDYGIQKLQMIYYNKNLKTTVRKHLIDILKGTLLDFYYVFPDEVLIDEGVEYELYFEVFDNDMVNGSKKTKSRVFSYYNRTRNEVKEALLKDQKETLTKFSEILEKSNQANSDIQKFKNSLLDKTVINWSDTKKLEEFLKRQSQYQEMFQKLTNKLENTINEQPMNETLEEKREELQKRMREVQKLAKNEKMLEDLKELTKKLNKEELIDKLKELTNKNRRNEQSLERILELTKRFYVEQKANQIAEKLEKLAEEEKKLSKSIENTPNKQEQINNDFKKIRKDINEINEQNNNLRRPMSIPDSEVDTKEIDEDLKKALDELKGNEQRKAKTTQKSASKKMNKLSASFEQSMTAMEGESIDENIDDLRKIVENLIEFSFQQEALLDDFSSSDNRHPEYSKNIRKQHKLKEYFEHIDDSLYVLSLRLLRMSSHIQKEVSDAHFYLDESLVNFTENRFDQGVSNQQFVMTAANNLANSLSDLLENLMNASPSFGSGKGARQKFSLPDIIQKQEELLDQVKEGMKEQKKGEGKGEQLSGELYEIYKQQVLLKELLKSILGDDNSKTGNAANKVVKKMEDIERELIEKGFTQNLIQKIIKLNYELLKLENAAKEQGEDLERKSESNKIEYRKRAINKLMLENQYFNFNEILNRQSLPLRSIYKKKVQDYFRKKQIKFKNDSI
ncbi:MAG: hypothetical protein JKY16_01275 [Lutibacter sp.]|nr:hypothetical protein [Lutibacter sp.]